MKMHKGSSGSHMHTEREGRAMNEGAGELGGPHAGGLASNRGPRFGMNQHSTNEESPMRGTPKAEKNVPNRTGNRSGDDT